MKDIIAKFIGVAYIAKKNGKRDEAIGALKEGMALIDGEILGSSRATLVEMLAELLTERGARNHQIEQGIGDLEIALNLYERLNDEAAITIREELKRKYETFSDQKEGLERIKYLIKAQNIAPVDESIRKKIRQEVYKDMIRFIPETPTEDAVVTSLGEIDRLTEKYAAQGVHEESVAGEIKAQVYFKRAEHIMSPLLKKEEVRQEDLPTMKNCKSAYEICIQLLIEGGYQESEEYHDAVARSRALGATINDLRNAWAKHPYRVFSISHDQEDRYLVNELR